MTPKTLNRNNATWPEVKIFFTLGPFLTKCVKIYLVCGRICRLVTDTHKIRETNRVKT
jgi:hypothetical protein